MDVPVVGCDRRPGLCGAAAGLAAVARIAPDRHSLAGRDCVSDRLWHGHFCHDLGADGFCFRLAGNQRPVRGAAGQDSLRRETERTACLVCGGDRCGCDMSHMKKLANRLLLLGLLLAPALALAQPSLQLSLPQKSADPSLWHVKGPAGEAYLFGSVHVLPPGLAWQTPAIRRALARSDVYVFEVPQDEKAVAELSGLMQQKGFLPPGQSLRGLLHREARSDYDAAVAASGLPPAAIDRDRPWLAGLQLMFGQMTKLHFDRDTGVEAVLSDRAAREHKQMRYLETISEQFALLAPDNDMLELEEFESGLK